jgi:hypothetical protein
MVSLLWKEIKNRPPKYEVQNKNESNKSRGYATINTLKIFVLGLRLAHNKRVSFKTIQVLHITTFIFLCI